MTDTPEKPISAGLKSALELGPLLLFFAGYMLLKDREFTIGAETYSGFIVITAAFIPLLVASTLILWRLSGKLSPMQILTLVLVIGMGGLSVWLNDERFFKMKPTILYVFFGAVLGFGLTRGESYLRVVMEGLMPLQHEGWLILTRRFMAFFFALAVANELIWRNFSTELWVNFKIFGLTIAMFAFFLSQNRLFSAYAAEDENGV
ncbi:inner membrane-spanning protein YciB [Aliiroseovarius sp. PTFE2010]|uniref:inner membrane-spanning protein YciB n=1 Tax=Aliiroseovarius sp. PTFE2010 TaxID=3417190 RepID=UPI003CF20733